MWRYPLGFACTVSLFANASVLLRFCAGLSPVPCSALGKCESTTFVCRVSLCGVNAPFMSTCNGFTSAEYFIITTDSLRTLTNNKRCISLAYRSPPGFAV